MFIVFDLDDTLADTTHREHILLKDNPPDENTKWSRFFEACTGDTLIKEIADIFYALTYDPDIFDHHVEIWTARSESVRKQTHFWLIPISL